MVKKLFAYDCYKPNHLHFINLVDDSDCVMIKSAIRLFLKEQIEWMDDRHLDDVDVDNEITRIVDLLNRNGESNFIYSFCFYLKNV